MAFRSRLCRMALRERDGREGRGRVAAGLCKGMAERVFHDGFESVPGPGIVLADDGITLLCRDGDALHGMGRESDAADLPRGRWICDPVSVCFSSRDAGRAIRWLQAAAPHAVAGRNAARSILDAFHTTSG